MNQLKIFLFPFYLLYAIGIICRNFAYSTGIFKTQSFDLPVISVGNLSLGGTGKSPHVEYLLQLLSPLGKIATLSRGYGRKSKGLLIANADSTVYDLGDEPSLFSKKYPEVIVAVDANRVHGIHAIRTMFPDIKGIILDDAFQHKSVKPGISILLTDYSKLYINDHLLPIGTLRDLKSESIHANIIIVAKCPDVLSPLDRRIIIKKLNPWPHQNVYFSYIQYGDIFPVFESKITHYPGKDYYFREHFSVVLVTGIANPAPLVYHIKPYVNEFVHIQFRDHHWFGKKDIVKIKTVFGQIADNKKIILTTEKDMMRFKVPDIAGALEGMPVFYLPIRVAFHGRDAEAFNKQITDYVTRNSQYSKISAKED